jgi:ubiquinone/menaquinone biosynthesis C-methylase UbiE
MAGLTARLYEPILGRLLGGVRRAGLALCPPRPGAKVVDVGCGTGEVLARYAVAGCRVAGLDASAGMLAEARRRLGPGALLITGEATALPFTTGTADLVMAMMLFHTLLPEDRPAALAEMARVAGGRGRVLIADYGPRREPGLRARLARGLAGAIERLAGHGGGVRSLRAAGGLAGLAPSAGMLVEAEWGAAGGAIAVTLLRPVGRPSR